MPRITASARVGSHVRLTLLAAVGAALTVTLGACASSQPGPAKLELQSLGQRDAAAMSAGAYFGGFVLDGTLPSGPSKAPVYGWAPDATVPSAEVATLAEVFGVTGTPVRHPHGWEVRSAAGVLRVRDGAGAPWQFVSTAALTDDPCLVTNLDIDSASNDGVASSCATAIPGGVASASAVRPTASSGPAGDAGGSSGSGAASGSGGVSAPGTVQPTPAQPMTAQPMTEQPGFSPTAASPLPPTAKPKPSASPAPVPSGTPIPVDEPVVPATVVHALADPVLKALGVSGRETVTPGMGRATATLDPSVDGLPTVGFSTTVTVTRTRVYSANGWLTAPTAGETYPLISAQAAFKLLSERPVPALGMPCISPTDGTSGCASPEPTVITGAELGLQLDYGASYQPLLVPAWLFTARGSDYPISQVAVEPAYLTTPTPAPTSAIPPSAATGGGSGGAGTSGSSGSSVGAEPAPNQTG